MYCPFCGAVCEAQDKFCSHCGAPFSQNVPEKKGRHWVPVLIMALIFVFGTTLFFALPGETADFSGGVTDSSMPWFQIDDGILYFSPAEYDGSSELTIPESVADQTVTALADGCFENCSFLKEVTLPTSLQAIGEQAFRGCTALRGIKMPESVRIIGKEAFSGCTALEAVCCYDGVKSIGNGAFTGCNKLFYIYFVGKYETWNQLYSEFVTENTVVFCENGSFYQGGGTN